MLEEQFKSSMINEDIIQNNEFNDEEIKDGEYYNIEIKIRKGKGFYILFLIFRYTGVIFTIEQIRAL